MNTPIPQKRTAVLTKKTKLSSRVYELEFAHKTPETMDFVPGQFISLQVAPAAFRSYSIASDFRDTSKIKLLVSAEHEGVGANYLRNLDLQQEITFIGPSGRFWLREPYQDTMHFFATGTGVAPFLAHFYKLMADGYKGCVRLYFGVRNDDELFYTYEIEKLKSLLPNFDFLICKSEEGKKVTDCIADIADTNAAFYLCGHPMMIVDVERMLNEKGVSSEHIYFEKFTVSTQPK